MSITIPSESKKFNRLYNHNPLVKRFIIVSGLPASGKSLAKNVCEKLNIQAIEMSEILKDFINNSQESVIRNLQNVDLRKAGHIIRKEKGKNFVAKITDNFIKNNHISTGVIIGCRNTEELDYFIKEYGKENVKLIYIRVDENVRIDRWLKRNKPNDPKSIEEANLMTESELEYGIKKLEEIADFIISNNGSIEEFKKKFEEIIFNTLL
ncbi:MAG: AAA family ATPase [Candidatus Anstonellales archaeon]